MGRPRLRGGVDRLDVAILRSLYGPWGDRHGRPNAWTVARAVGAHGTTVKRRLARLRASGVLRSVRLAPAPAVLGARATFAWLAFPDGAAKARGMADLAAQPEVLELHDFVGVEAAAWVYAPHPEEPAKALARLARAAEAAEARALLAWAPEVARPVTPLDARIMAALVEDADRPLSAVARAAGVTAKTVRTRLRAMAAAGAFSTYPAVSFADVRGAVAFVLVADLAPGAGAKAGAALLRAFPDHVCAGAGGGRAFAYLVAPSSAEAGAALDRARALRGVAEARLLLVRGHAMFPPKVLARLAVVHPGVPGPPQGQGRDAGPPGREP